MKLYKLKSNVLEVNMCKVSVIIPIYNSDRNLNKCLNSVRNQTHEDLEIILFDNGSTDNSKQIAKGYARFDKRVSLFNINNLEMHEVINYVTDNSTGEYILYVDSKNSWLDKNAIKIMIEKAEQFNSDIMQVDYHQVENNSLLHNNKSNKDEELILDNKHLTEELNKGDIVRNNIWGKLYKTDLIKEMLVTNKMKVEESRWMTKLINQVKKYLILHKPMIYQIKES